MIEYEGRWYVEELYNHVKPNTDAPSFDSEWGAEEAARACLWSCFVDDVYEVRKHVGLDRD